MTNQPCTAIVGGGECKHDRVEGLERCRYHCTRDELVASRDAEIDRMRQQLSQVRDVISKNGCDCDCDHDPGDECLACRVAMAMNGGENV